MDKSGVIIIESLVSTIITTTWALVAILGGFLVSTILQMTSHHVALRFKLENIQRQNANDEEIKTKCFKLILP